MVTESSLGLYPSELITVSSGMYTKHYYNGSSRIASRIGGGFNQHNDLNNYSPALDHVQLQNGNDYTNKAQQLRNVWSRNASCAGLDQNLEYAYSLELNPLFANSQPDGARYFYHSDASTPLSNRLGSSAYITTENGYATQFLAYTCAEPVECVPFGETLSEQQNSTSYYSPFTFSAKEKDTETGYSYFGARYYSPELSVWLGVDPLSDKYPSLSPYNYCALNPVMLVDPDGRSINPIYDYDGNFLGTDDLGIQGEAIIMDRSDFKQGMSHKEAVAKGTFRSNLPLIYKNEFFDKIDNHHSALSSRPDWDGHLTLDEANDWYRNGGGQPLFTDLSKIDLSGIFSLGEKYVGQVKTVNLLLSSKSLNDGLVYGNITLKRYSNHQVRAFADYYDFGMHNQLNPLNWGRNMETLIGRMVAGEGKPYEINIYGSTRLKPQFPWTK